MQLNNKSYLDLESEFCQYESAKVVILPFPYEGGISSGGGAGEAPAAVIEASAQLEFYDEILKFEPYRVGIATLAPPDLSGMSPERMFDTIYGISRRVLADGKFLVVVGGDHSISSGYCQALFEKNHSLSVVQIDAHSDLRDSYLGSKLSHASIMSRVREMTKNTLQVGMRAISREEAELIEHEKIPVFTMTEYRRDPEAAIAVLKGLPDPVFITLDVDAFDWSVIWSTGTPEPGGFTWDEMMDFLTAIFRHKQVVGFDVVELSASPFDRNSPHAVAKLIYRMIGLWLHYQTASALDLINPCLFPHQPS